MHRLFPGEALYAKQEAEQLMEQVSSRSSGHQLSDSFRTSLEVHLDYCVDAMRANLRLQWHSPCVGKFRNGARTVVCLAISRQSKVGSWFFRVPSSSSGDQWIIAGAGR